MRCFSPQLHTFLTDIYNELSLSLSQTWLKLRDLGVFVGSLFLDIKLRRL